MRTVFALLPLAGLAFGVALPQRGHGSTGGGQTTTPSTRTSSGGGQTTHNTGLGGNDFSGFTGGNNGLGSSDPTNAVSTGGRGTGSRTGGSDPTDVLTGGFGGGSRSGGDPTDVTSGGHGSGGRGQGGSDNEGQGGHGQNHGNHSGNNSDSDPEDPDSDDDSHHGHHSDPGCDDNSPPSYPKCGGLPSPNQPTCDSHSVCIEDPSHPCGLSFACYGICVPKKAPKCGGFAGLSCPKGLQCVADSPLHGTASCDPRNGGADCFGICI